MWLSNESLKKEHFRTFLATCKGIDNYFQDFLVFHDNVHYKDTGLENKNKVRFFWGLFDKLFSRYLVSKRVT